MNIPMVDLKEQFETLKEEIYLGLKAMFESSQFIFGPNVKALEQEVADYCRVKHAIGVASGTDALHLGLRAAGIGPGDEVITTPFTFIATAEAIAYLGATPVFVDIDPKTYNIDVDQIATAITEKTRAVLPVHLFGQPADLLPIVELCQRHGLRLVEDCAQSFGADYQGEKTGNWGDVGCFSFFPSKNLGCFGDGGMIVTNDDDIAEELRILRNHGSHKQYHHSIIGYNSRLDEMQAVILRVKLKHIDTYNQRRRENAQLHNQLLAGLPLITPYEDGKGNHVYHQYTLQLDQRDKVQQALRAAGIASAVYYPIPLHRQEVFQQKCSETSCPVAEQVSQRVLSLPMFPEMTSEQIETVCQTLRKVLEGQGRE